MPDEPNENDDEFLSYLTRVGSRWTGLAELIDQRIAEAQKKTPRQSESSGNYLEAQNKLLLEMLLKRDTQPPASEQLTPKLTEDGQASELKPNSMRSPKSEQIASPNENPPAKKAFWR